MTTRRDDERDLERALGDLGNHLDHPRADGMAAAVATHLRSMDTGPTAAPARRFAPRSPAGRVAAAVAATVAVLFTAVQVSPAVADLFGLGGIRIVGSDTSPVLPRRAGPDLALGRPVTLAQAQAAVPFRIALPRRAGLAEPVGVFLDDRPPGPRVALTYAPAAGLPAASATGVGLLLTQFEGSAVAFGGKLTGPGTRVEQVSVAGSRGLWIEGAEHGFMYEAPDGNVYPETARLAGAVLLWERAGVTFRLESALSRDDAIRLAETVR